MSRSTSIAARRGRPELPDPLAVEKARGIRGPLPGRARPHPGSPRASDSLLEHAGARVPSSLAAMTASSSTIRTSRSTSSSSSERTARSPGPGTAQTSIGARAPRRRPAANRRLNGAPTRVTISRTTLGSPTSASCSEATGSCWPGPGRSPEEALAPLEDGSFRVGEEDWSPERLRFDAIVDGEALARKPLGLRLLPRHRAVARRSDVVAGEAERPRAREDARVALVGVERRADVEASTSHVIVASTSARVRQSPRAMPDVARKRTAAERGSPSRIAYTVWLVSSESEVDGERAAASRRDPSRRPAPPARWPGPAAGTALRARPRGARLRAARSAPAPANAGRFSSSGRRGRTGSSIRLSLREHGQRAPARARATPTASTWARRQPVGGGLAGSE